MLLLIIAGGILLLCNCISFNLFYNDKLKAIHHERRIPEKTLLSSAFFGPFGAFLGMHLCRHKTKKWYFHFWVGLFIVIHILLIVFLVVAFDALGNALAGEVGRLFQGFKSVPD